MDRISIDQFKSTKLHSGFNSSILTIELLDKPFAEGACGKVYKCSVNNINQAVKIFTTTEKKGYETICKLQDAVIAYNQRLKTENKKQVEEINALWALPLFSFKGKLKGTDVVGYSSHLLDDKRWINFDELFSETTLQQRRIELQKYFYGLPFELRMKLICDLLEGFVAFQEMKFVYADLNPKNFFINIRDRKLCLIDYDSGGVNEEPETIGKNDDWQAPEIINKERTTANLFTDYWSIAITIHYFFFPFQPFFYWKGQSKKLMEEYFKKYKYPAVNTKESNFNTDMEKKYSIYVESLKNIPPDIFRAFIQSFQNGYFANGARLTSRQWLKLIEPFVSNKNVSPTKPVINNSGKSISFQEKKYCNQCRKPYYKPTSNFCSYCRHKRN